MRRNQIHNRVIKTITTIAGIIAILSICCLDSQSYIPFISLAISGTWVFLFLLANAE